MAGMLDAGLATAAALGARRLRDRWHSVEAASLADHLIESALEPTSDAIVLEPQDLR